MIKYKILRLKKSGIILWEIIRFSQLIINKININDVQKIVLLLDRLYVDVLKKSQDCKQHTQMVGTRGAG